MYQEKKRLMWEDECQPLTNEQIVDIKSQFHPSNTANVVLALPTGSIITTMGKVAPDGYLVCDGTVYNIEDYQNLANYFTAQFESANYFGGDGETTFAVPDLRGEFLRGSGTNSHTNQGSGSEVGEHQDGTITTPLGANHENGTSYMSACISAEMWDGYANADFAYPRIGNNGWITCSSNASQRTPRITSRPTNTSVLYSIKY